MTEVTVNPQALLDTIGGAFDAANDVVVSTVAARQVRRTGRLASSYALSQTFSDGTRAWVYLTSPVPYAMAVERGAWVHGRGPHMKGKFLLKRTVYKVYGDAMKAALPQGLKPRKTFLRKAQVVYK